MKDRASGSKSMPKSRTAYGRLQSLGYLRTVRKWARADRPLRIDADPSGKVLAWWEAAVRVVARLRDDLVGATNFV